MLVTTVFAAGWVAFFREGIPLQESFADTFGEYIGKPLAWVTCAGQTNEDAYALGRCLERIPEVPYALQRHEQLRRRKAYAVVKSSWQIGQLAQLDSRVGAWCRNQVVECLPASLNRWQLEMLFSLDYVQG